MAEPTRFTRQYPMEGEDPADPEVFMVSAGLFARHLRRASKAEDDSDRLFCLVCAMVEESEAVIERLDARDYAELSKIVEERLGNLPAPRS